MVKESDNGMIRATKVMDTSKEYWTAIIWASRRAAEAG